MARNTMNAPRLHDRILGIPWLYDRIRPLVVGGIDHRALAEFCEITSRDRVFDLGCGTGRIVPYLTCAEYLGADLDVTALRRAQCHAAPNRRFMAGDAWDTSVRELQPTVVLMIGVVHHVNESEFGALVRRVAAGSESLGKIVSIEVSYFPGRLVNNLLSRLDRGKFVRRPAEYEGLFRRCGLNITRTSLISTRAGYVSYLGYHLAPQ